MPETTDDIIEEVEPVDELDEDAGIDEETLRRRDAALARVVKWGDPILKTKARPVARFDDALREQVAQMEVIMHDGLGIGLAATQVGILNRVLVYRVQRDGPAATLVNPELTWHSGEEEIAEEGCLSLPRVHVDVERPVYVRVTAQDAFGAPVAVEASGLEARVIQHEMDHLDGVLILDRTERDQKKDAIRSLREWQVEQPQR